MIYAKINLSNMAALEMKGVVKNAKADVRLSKDDERLGESVSIENQVIICKGGILPPNTYYDCGSFVMNRKAVIGKEKKSLVTAANSTQNGVVANNRKLKSALLAI